MQDIGAMAEEAFRRLAARHANDPASGPLPTPTGSDSAPSATLPLDLDPELTRLRLQHLLELPATEFLQRDLELLRARFDLTLSSSVRLAVATDIRRALARVDLGLERDAIQATRPEGCFCLGLGGRRPSFVLVPGDDTEPERTASTWVEYCGCPEGVAARERRDALLTVRTARLTAQRVDRVFGAPALRAYRDADIRTMEVTPENRAAFDHALAWADARQEDVTGSLLVTGPVGTGKTYLAVALLRRRVEQGESALFVTQGDYLQRIRDTFDAEASQSTADVLGTARTVGLLVFDDLGAKLKLTEWEEGQVYDLFNARITAALEVLVTTNLDGADLRDYLGERIYSRLMGMCRGNVLRWGGADRRLS